MTRDEVQGVLKHIDCAKAYVDGKIIQRLYNDGTWRDTGDTNFHYNETYRIKSEPEVVPFKNGDEFLEAIASQNSQFLVNKMYRNKVWPLDVNDKGIHIYIGSISYAELLNLYEFEDGTPCGKEV